MKASIEYSQSGRQPLTYLGAVVSPVLCFIGLARTPAPPFWWAIWGAFTIVIAIALVANLRAWLSEKYDDRTPLHTPSDPPAL